VGYQSPSIIKYLEPLTGDLFTARFVDCIFNEDHFPALREIISTKKNTGKLTGMLKVFPPLIHVLMNLNFKFKRSLLCKI
jgi:hypothetical protein